MDMINLLIAQNNYNIYRSCESIIENSKGREIVFLCVGNPKIWFDSFGPMMGSLLKQLNLEKFIYGNVDAPIASNNLESYIELIYKFHINPYIVVIDSSLSKSEESIVKIKDGNITCGALGNNPISVGDMYITYTINLSQAKSPSNYKQMLKSIKQVARMIYFVFSEDGYLKLKNI